MDKFLTIGQVAKFLDMSTHQIRHYEECGIITPIVNKENGYRLYGQDEIYRLVHILFLREFDISISEIKRCFKFYDKQEYLSVFKQKVNDIEERIKHLSELKDKTTKLCNSIETYEENKFEITQMPSRNLMLLKKMGYSDSITLQEFYKCSKHIKNINEKDLFYILNNKEMLVCIKTNVEDKIQLSQGKYLRHYFLADNDEVIEKKYVEFEKHIKKNQYKVSEPIILKDCSLLSIAYNNQICHEFQCKID